ncbi:hypothetical protein EWM64_g4955 [Hericium alpestre]|uniref:Uncharacterized protein n=1 Tax=Hericium alpestre TaxID=135208 RepID=A0A4Y9ZYA2_9AGAM|nr:hypothetical protein EWM64_g4955 [Hericium alpestre]
MPNSAYSYSSTSIGSPRVCAQPPPPRPPAPSRAAPPARAARPRASTASNSAEEPSSGLVVCSEGHVLQNYRNETNETNEMGPHTVQKRKLKSGRKKKAPQSKADPKLYHGERARFHYFECLQLLLRKQIGALTRAWDLPPQFEIICRDVWALHLSLLPVPPPAEPLLHEEDVDGAEPSQKPAQTAETPLPPISDKADEAKSPSDAEATERDEQQISSSEDEDEDAEPEADPEIDELLRGLSASSSSEEDESAADKPRLQPDSGRKKHKPKGALERHDGPASNIAVLVIALWTLRLPVMYVDFVRLIEAYTLPFLDPVRLLPPEMARHLTKHTVQALSPPHAPSPVLVHGLAARLARQLHASFGIFTPDLNAAPMLWRVVRALGGTPVLYDLTKTVAHVLSLPLTLHNTLAPALPQDKARDPARHIYDNVPPEVALAATVVIVLKMVYGLDGRVRAPKDPNDPACALPRMQDYLSLLRHMNDQEKQGQGAVFSARSNMSTAHLSAPMLDEYMDFCERALLGHVAKEYDAKVVDEYFPLPARKNASYAACASEEGATGAQGSMQAARPGEDAADGLEPGNGYMIYNSRDDLGSVPEDYEIVMQRAAWATGVGVEYMSGVVEKYERRVVRWWDMTRRRESREAREMEGEEESDCEDV